MTTLRGMPRFLLCNFFFWALLLFLTPLKADWFYQQTESMGTQLTIRFWHDNADQGAKCQQTVIDEFERIESKMSSYRDDSELSKINREAGIEKTRISKELRDLIATAIDFSRRSNGAFDISYATIGQDYNFRAQKKPSSGQIKTALPAVDYRLIELENDSIRFAQPTLRIDLGGIAKGYAVDRSIALLQKCGVVSALISAGGDTRVIGSKNGRPWVLGVQNPRQEKDITVRLPLVDSAISTSGDYERFFFDDGERIHHILDPKTGTPAKDAWSATVIGPDATSTDALSTTLFVLGSKAGLELIETMPQFEAIVIDNNGKMRYSSGLLDREYHDASH